MKDTEFADYSGTAKEIKRAIDEFRASHPEPMPIKVEISAFLDFDDDGGRQRTIGVRLTTEQCQELYSLASTDTSEAMVFLFRCYGLWTPMEIRNTKVWIEKHREGKAE